MNFSLTLSSTIMLFLDISKRKLFLEKYENLGEIKIAFLTCIETMVGNGEFACHEQMLNVLQCFK